MDFQPKKSSNKFSHVVQQLHILWEWKKLLPSSSLSTSGNDSGTLRRAESFQLEEKASTVVPKGCFAVSVGDVQKRFVVPTKFLGDPLFRVLLREAEEEFGFKQKGVLRIPCDVFMFEHVLRMMERKKKANKTGRRGRFGFGDDDWCYDSGPQVQSTFRRQSTRPAHLSIANALRC